MNTNIRKTIWLIWTKILRLNITSYFCTFAICYSFIFLTHNYSQIMDANKTLILLIVTTILNTSGKHINICLQRRNSSMMFILPFHIHNLYTMERN